MKSKEELEKEAEKYWIDQPQFTEIRDRVIQAYIDSAEPREKQIEIDAKQIRALQKQNGELTDKVKELEAQIEKMKRCAICKHSTDLGYCKIRCSGGECDNHSSWEIKEND